MSTAEMMGRIAETSPRFKARMAGGFQLLEALTALAMAAALGISLLAIAVLRFHKALD